MLLPRWTAQTMTSEGVTHRTLFVVVTYNQTPLHHDLLIAVVAYGEKDQVRLTPSSPYNHSIGPPTYAAPPLPSRRLLYLPPTRYIDSVSSCVTQHTNGVRAVA